MTDQAERFQIFLGILNAGDAEFVERRDAAAAKAFRKNRARIFRKELHQIRREAGRLYRLRASNVAEAGEWGAYAGLVWDTALSYWSIAKLRVAATLYARDLPSLVDATHNADRVLRFVTTQTPAASHASLTV